MYDTIRGFLIVPKLAIMSILASEALLDENKQIIAKKYYSSEY